MRHSLHNQFPTYAMTTADYEAALDTLKVQIGEDVDLYGGYPDGEAEKAAADALSQTFGTYEEQTVLDWTRDACYRVGADINRVPGL